MCFFLEASSCSFVSVESSRLQVDNENGVPLEHLITCAQDVQILYNAEKCYKYLQWDSNKTKLLAGSTLDDMLHVSSPKMMPESESNCAVASTALADDPDADVHLLEESQRKQSQLGREVIELVKSVNRCIIPVSRFNSDYHRKYGRQCRVADFGHTKLIDLLESLPHIVQIIDGELEKHITLTHRVQVGSRSNYISKFSFN